MYLIVPRKMTRRITQLIKQKKKLDVVYSPVGVYSSGYYKYPVLEFVKEIESEIRHDVMAMVRALTEACGPSGAYIHLGATSSDILDTATALQLKEALTLIGKNLNDP